MIGTEISPELVFPLAEKGEWFNLAEMAYSRSTWKEESSAFRQSADQFMWHALLLLSMTDEETEEYRLNIVETSVYCKRLAAHDWTYDWSDDPRVVAAGRAERKALEELQKRLDPDKHLWKRYERK